MAEKDMTNLPECTERIRAHSLNPIKKIYVIGAARLQSRLPSDSTVEWVDEESLHPNLLEVRSALAEMGNRHDNAGWYFQQLLKLCAFRILGPVGDHLLIYDSDAVPVHDMPFVDGQGRSLLAYGYPLIWRLNTRYHSVPVQHSAVSSATRLVPGWRAVDAYSGIQHHMVMDRVITNELMYRVEEHHGSEFWRAFLASVEKPKWHGISEYVIYRHFAIANFPDAVLSRHLNLLDIVEPVTGPYDLAEVARAAPEHVDVVGCHRFSRYEQTLETMDYIPPDLRQEMLAEAAPLSLHMDRGLLTVAALDTTGDGLEEQLRRNHPPAGPSA
ncbi:DUF6492 family protein [Streptomyces sp. NPDC092307]|uniref:DUF6492 family protein n=1 Tax=Streptomyces sp. NPDC092307 TaxID=3366013 RepID=UPI003814121E